MNGPTAPLSCVPNQPTGRDGSGVNVIGYFGSEKGVGEMARSLLRVLDWAHVPNVANNLVDTGSLGAEPLPANLSESFPFTTNVVIVNADQFADFSQDHSAAFKSRRNIAYWAWELSHFPKEWVSAFEFCDEVWTISGFARDAIAQQAPVPVKVVPCSLDVAHRPIMIDSEAFGIRDDVFVFLFMFDFHSAMERKNPLGLITAFKKAFGARRDVELLIKSSHGRDHTEELTMLHEHARGANIRFLDKVLSRDAITSLLMAADCYVSLHRAEGFGLTMAEAMLRGKPTIATDYSGNRDFLSAANGFPVPYKLVDIQGEHGPYREGQWAQPDLDYAADVMRFIEQNRVVAAAIGRQAKADVSHALHPVTIGKKMLSHLGAVEVPANDTGLGQLPKES